MENYYLILGLTIERFISDISELDAALEKKKNEWNSSNNTNIKANVYRYYDSGVIKAAYNNPSEWKRIYDEAKEIVDSDIRLFLQVTSGKGFVTQKELEKSFKKYKSNASIKYAQKIADSLDIRIGEQKPDPTPHKQAKLKDFEPEASSSFKAPSEQLKVINCTDYYHFLREYSKKINSASASIAFSEDTDAERCATTAKEIEAAWAGKKENEEVSAIKKVCGQIEGFNQSGAKSQDNYNKYLVWQGIKDVIAKLWSAFSASDENSRILTSSVQSEFINQLVEIVADRQTAEDLLEEECLKRNIQMPKKVINVGVCPFCNNSFEKKEGISPSECPNCHKSFMVTSKNPY